jgi:hypothetical protein
MPIRTDPTARPSAAEAPGPAASRPGSAGPAAPSVPAGRPAAHPAPRRPDPTTARLAVAAGGIATLSALVAAIAGAAVPAPAAAAPTAQAAVTPGPVQTIVRYVYVQPGQTTPPAGIATTVAAPAPRQVPAPVVTRQSGAKP